MGIAARQEHQARIGRELRKVLYPLGAAVFENHSPLDAKIVRVLMPGRTFHFLKGANLSL